LAEDQIALGNGRILPITCDAGGRSRSGSHCCLLVGVTPEGSDWRFVRCDLGRTSCTHGTTRSIEGQVDSTWAWPGLCGSVRFVGRRHRMEVSRPHDHEAHEDAYHAHRREIIRADLVTRLAHICAN